VSFNFTFSRSVVSVEDIPSPGLPEICISGRSNVGKSSMINRLANRKNLARTSQKPGLTRALNIYIAKEGFNLIDLPGYGYAKVPKAERNLFARLVNPYLENRQTLRGIIQLIDARLGPTEDDRTMIDWIKKWGGNVLYIFTKSDKLSAREITMLSGTYREEFGVENMVIFSARTGMGLDSVQSWIKRILGLESQTRN
jgi:GTP-binding protein